MNCMRMSRVASATTPPNCALLAGGPRRTSSSQKSTNLEVVGNIVIFATGDAREQGGVGGGFGLIGRRRLAEACPLLLVLERVALGRGLVLGVRGHGAVVLGVTHVSRESEVAGGVLGEVEE